MACNGLSGVGPLLYCMAIGLPKIFYNNAFAVKMFVATGRELGCVDGHPKMIDCQVVRKLTYCLIVMLWAPSYIIPLLKKGIMIMTEGTNNTFVHFLKSYQKLQSAPVK